MTGGAPRGDADATAPDVRELARAFGQSPSAIAVVTGAEHTLLYANRAFHDLVAEESGDARAGAPVSSALHGRAARALSHVLDRARGGRCPWRGVLPAGVGGDASGDGWPCAVWAFGGGEGAGEPSALVVEVDASTVSALARLRYRDLTERVLLSAFREEDRAEAADIARVAAEQANTARRQLVAAMSHDLRTPLQAIGGYARLFEMGLLGPVTDRQQDALVRIQGAMEHVLGLAATLLDHERLESGQVEFTIADVAAPAALGEAVALLRTQAEAKRVALRAGPCDPHLVVRADAGKLRQVLVNLLGNAVKFTTAGGSVTATCEPVVVDGAGACVAFRVTDTGRGIAPEDLGRVFDPYTQVGRALSASDAGLGLGLAISRAFALGMGGSLTVESAMGRGSMFTLSLPRVSTPQASSEAG